MNSQSEELEIDLKEIILFLKKKIILILLAGLVCGTGMGVYSKYMITPQYKSDAKVYILSGGGSVSSSSVQDLLMGSTLAQDYMELVYSRTVINQVIANMELDETYKTLKGKVGVATPTDTRILQITVTYDNPYMAKAIVDEFAYVVKSRISAIMATDEPNVIDEGEVDMVPVGPNTKKQVAIATIFGMYFMDDTIKTPEDVEKYMQLNVLGLIPAEDEKREVPENE